MSENSEHGQLKEILQGDQIEASSGKRKANDDLFDKNDDKEDNIPKEKISRLEGSDDDNDDKDDIGKKVP